MSDDVIDPGATVLHPVDAIVALVGNDPAKLLSDEVIALSAALSELDGARLRQRLSQVKLKTIDFAKIVKARQRSAAAAIERDSEALPDDWRARLRLDRLTGRPRASFANLALILEHTYAHRLAFDEMAAVPLFDGNPLEDAALAAMRRSLEEQEDLEFSRADVADAILLVAKQHAFHPVRRYLREISWDGVRRLELVAADYFGAEDPLSRKLVIRFFIAAVARAEHPGCKVDNALVLFGDEGLKKSTFFRVLGGLWFKDSKVDITDRKGMMLMHSAWIYEWPEVDRMLEKRHDSDVKAYVTQQDDSFVPMYGRSVVTLDRSNVTVGTTNKEKFITSDTGSRRWWVVTVKKRIDADRLRAVRDQLWAEASHLYASYLAEQAKGILDDENPFRWWLVEEEEQGRAARNEEHLTVSPDEETVEAWLRGEPVTCAMCRGTGAGHGHDMAGNVHPCAACAGARRVTRGELPKDPRTGREYVTHAEVLNGPLGVPLERHQQNAARVASVLRRLGWRSGKRIRPNGRDGARVVPYYSPVLDPDADAAETGITEAGGAWAPPPEPASPPL